MGTAPDAHSDLDLYVYLTGSLTSAEHVDVASAFADRLQLENHLWEDGDEWLMRDSGLPIDVTFRRQDWIADQLARVITQHQASLGYTTAFWFNIQHSQALFDRDGWFAELQRTTDQPYPTALRQAIIAKNHLVLRSLLHSSYLAQLTSAAARGDLISLQHRSTALLTSYFDILFAVNDTLIPGEKKLLDYAGALPSKPTHMVEDLTLFLRSAAMPDKIIPATITLLDRLDQFLSDADLSPDLPYAEPKTSA